MTGTKAVRFWRLRVAVMAACLLVDAPIALAVWLGVSVMPANQQHVVVYGVLEGGPAAKAGLKLDDVILSVGGQPVTDLTTFHEAVGRLAPSEAAPIEMERGGKRSTVSIIPETLSADGGLALVMDAAAQGEPWAMRDVAVRLSHMDKTRAGAALAPRDNEAAVQWYWRAIEAGDTMAPYLLGHIYLRGVVVTQDDAVAKELFELARKNADNRDLVGARRGLASAASTELAHMCLQRRGSNSTPEQAEALLKDAVANGSPRAMYLLGELYEKGEHVARDPQKAVTWYRMAARLNYKLANDAVLRVALPGAQATQKPAVAASAAATRPAAADGAAASAAAKSAPSDVRYLWKHSGGFFRFDGDGAWIESFRDPAVSGGTFTFKEAFRTAEAIELHDASRNISVRLTDDAALLRIGDAADYSPHFNGSWFEIPAESK